MFVLGLKLYTYLIRPEHVQVLSKEMEPLRIGLTSSINASITLRTMEAESRGTRGETHKRRHGAASHTYSAWSFT